MCQKLSLVLLLAMAWSMIGCASPSADRAAANLPWWVAKPSAPLPEDFPALGAPGEVIVKQYPVYRAAVARSTSARDPQDLFFPLFNHIEKNHISMSSPVEMTYGGAPKDKGDAATPQSMAFIYGDPKTGALGKEGNVEVVETPAMTVASVGVTGSYTAEHFDQGRALLDAWLKAHPEYASAGTARYLAYNSPFVLPFMRYGEVQIPIRKAGI